MAHVLLTAVLPYLRPVRDVVRLAGVSAELRGVLRHGYEGSTLGDDVPLERLPALLRCFPGLRRVLLRGTGGDALPPSLAGMTHLGLVGFAVVPSRGDAALLAGARDLTLAVCTLAPGSLGAVVDAAATRLTRLHVALATAFVGGGGGGVSALDAADVAAALRRVDDMTLDEGQPVEEALRLLVAAPPVAAAVGARHQQPPACRRLRVVGNGGFTGGATCGGLGAALPSLACLTLERCGSFTAAHLNGWRPPRNGCAAVTARIVACPAFVPAQVEPARWRRVVAAGEAGGAYHGAAPAVAGGGGVGSRSGGRSDGPMVTDWEAVVGVP
jgi:hypothetical protein